MRFSLSVPLLLAATTLVAAEPSPRQSPVQRGYQFLVDKPYLPPDFDQETFDATWKYWPEPLKSEAAKLSPDDRRKMAFDRYGLTPRPDDPSKDRKSVG